MTAVASTFDSLRCGYIYIGKASQTVEISKKVRDLEISPQLSKLTVAGGKTIRIYDASTFDLVHEQELGFDIEGK